MKISSLPAAGFPRLSAKLCLLLAVSLLLIPAGRVTAQTFTTLYSFTGGSDGAQPAGGLILSGNTLYGTASSGGGSGSYGTVFAVNTDGTGFRTLYTFTGGSDGRNPQVGLILSGNTLYGTTTGGGTLGSGTVFAVNTDGTGFTVLHNFPCCSGDGGASPGGGGGLILSGNTLYGATGGCYCGYGTLFAVNTDGTGFRTLYTFTGGSDGRNPDGGLILSGNTLYGATSGSQFQFRYGTVYAVNTDGTGFTTLHSFNSDFANGGLILSGNTLYGTTATNGGYGTVYAVNTDGTGFTTLHGFQYNEGASPNGGLILSGNTLYGTTLTGSRFDIYGTVFALNTDGTGFTTLYVFSGGSDGANPEAGLILSGNTLYGTAFSGGTMSNGTVFSLRAPPMLTSLSPSSKTVGSPGFTLTVNGSNFVQGATVSWNNSARSTSFVSSIKVTAQIPATDLVTAGTVPVIVTNPGSGPSNSLTFTINNPRPNVTSISPSSATAGGPGFTLTVNGSGFIATSVVNWNGSARTTTFSSSTQLTAAISAADIASAGTIHVTVTNPGPGGGTSAPKTFTVNNPVPAISSISPSSATAGGPGFTLTVNGSNFVSGSKVHWNSLILTTTFVSSIQVTATVPSSDIRTAGTVSVTVVNALPGGGTSNAMTFTVNNPVPSISSIVPSSATAGGPAFTLTVNGSNFVLGSVVDWNGSARTTTFASRTRVTASISAADIATPGTASVTVVNAPPGGGTSNAETFTINP